LTGSNRNQDHQVKILALLFALIFKKMRSDFPEKKGLGKCGKFYFVTDIK